jgi:hypothetical protein
VGVAQLNVLARPAASDRAEHPGDVARGEQVVADRPRDAVADQPGKALLVLRDLWGDLEDLGC